MPFSTSLLAELMRIASRLLVYWLNIPLPGVLLYATWGVARRERLVKDDLAPEVPAAIRRIIVAQSLYALGALLCVISTYRSIAFIVLVQLNCAMICSAAQNPTSSDGRARSFRHS